MISSQDLAGGTTVGISIRATATGSSDTDAGRFDLSDFQPGTPAFWSAVIFVLLIVAVMVLTGAIL